MIESLHVSVFKHTYNKKHMILYDKSQHSVGETSIYPGFSNQNISDTQKTSLYSYHKFTFKKEYVMENKQCCSKDEFGLSEFQSGQLVYDIKKEWWGLQELSHKIDMSRLSIEHDLERLDLNKSLLGLVRDNYPYEYEQAMREVKKA